MKLNILKKLTALGLCVPMLITGCSNDKVETGNKEEIGDVIYRIGITEYMEHPSLDAAREGFVDEMEKLGVK
jgi:putative ABC transport system substrate-binding protein